MSAREDARTTPLGSGIEPTEDSTAGIPLLNAVEAGIRYELEITKASRSQRLCDEGDSALPLSRADVDSYLSRLYNLRGAAETVEAFESRQTVEQTK